MAAIQAHAIIEHRLPLLLVLISAIGEPAIGLKKHSRAEILLAVPPVRWARSGAAGAEDAFVEAVQLLAVGR